MFAWFRKQREAEHCATEPADAESATFRLQGCANAVTISQTTKLGRPCHLSSGYAADDLKGAKPSASSFVVANQRARRTSESAWTRQCEMPD